MIMSDKLGRILEKVVVTFFKIENTIFLEGLRKASEILSVYLLCVDL
jgi:hypothetical protein